MRATKRKAGVWLLLGLLALGVLAAAPAEASRPAVGEPLAVGAPAGAAGAGGPVPGALAFAEVAARAGDVAAALDDPSLRPQPPPWDGLSLAGGPLGRYRELFPRFEAPADDGVFDFHPLRYDPPRSFGSRRYDGRPNLETRIRAFELPEPSSRLGLARVSLDPATVFGLRLAETSVGPTKHGLWTDPVTGFGYARARWLDHRNASWLSEDPAGTVDSTNLYAYVGWGPQSAVDPSGQSLICLAQPGVCAGMALQAKDIGRSILEVPLRVFSEDAAARKARADAYLQGGYGAYRDVVASQARELEARTKEAAWEAVPGVGSGQALGEAFEACSNGGQIECGRRLVDAGGRVTGDVGVAYGAYRAGAKLAEVYPRTSFASERGVFQIGSGHFPTWKPGDPITKATTTGQYPAWYEMAAADKGESIQGRYWMNRSLDASAASEFSRRQLRSMKSGFAPQASVLVRNNKTLQLEVRVVSKELHHARGNRGTAGFDEPVDLREVWPWEHAQLDPNRKTGYTFVDFMDE